MTDEELDKLEKLLALATDAPWFVDRIANGDWEVWYGDQCDPRASYLLTRTDGQMKDEDCRADVDLIAAARNALPSLIESARAANRMRGLLSGCLPIVRHQARDCVPGRDWVSKTLLGLVDSIEKELKE